MVGRLAAHFRPAPRLSANRKINCLPRGEVVLEVKGLNKSFGPVHVLHDIDFTVRAGEVIALVGDNGAGKSTLVKCIAGISGIDSGQISFEGRPVTISSPSVAPTSVTKSISQNHSLADNLDIT